jgi:hypothetical protein
MVNPLKSFLDQSYPPFSIKENDKTAVKTPILDKEARKPGSQEGRRNLC